MSKKLLPIREVIREYNLYSNKSFGQNFIHDLNLTKKIASCAGNLSSTNVIEVGPGPGALTRSLLDAGAMKVYAIEYDSRFRGALTDIQEAFPNRLQVINGDAMSLNILTLCSKPRKIVANLPYNIATPLLLSWLKSASQFERLTLMFQKEVADRLIAKPKTKAYGRLSVMSQWLCEVKAEFNIPKESFYPPPNVTSTIVSLKPRILPIGNINWESLEIITAAAFGQRRKMLKSSLKPLGISIENCGISPTKRAEELSIKEFCTLALEFKNKNFSLKS